MTSTAFDLDAPTLRRRFAIIGALVVRDLMSRFGRNSLGFVWTVLEPMILTAGVMILWSVLRASEFHGMPVAAFVLSGYMPLTLWRHMTNPMTHILRNNTSLLYHRVITHMDIVLARAVLEFFSTTAALCFVYFIVVTLGIVDPMDDPGLAMAGWLYTGWFYFGIGLFMAAFTELWEPAEKFIQPIQYLALPISGVFFLVDWVPGYGQRLLAWNPMVNCTEMFRAGFFGPTISTTYDAGYLTLCCMTTSFIGFVSLFYVRDHIRQS